MSNSELISLFQQGSSLATSDKFHIHTANGRLLTVSAETVLAYLRRSQTTFTLDENGYVIINGENTGYKIEPTDVAALTSRLASLEATTGNILDLSEPVASPTLVEAINKAANLGGVDIDSELSSTSTNPVENKVVTKELNTRITNTTFERRLTSYQLKSSMSEYAKTETLDGYAKISDIPEVDSDLSEDSENAVQNKTITSAIKQHDGDIFSLQSTLNAVLNNNFGQAQDWTIIIKEESEVERLRSENTVEGVLYFGLEPLEDESGEVILEDNTVTISYGTEYNSNTVSVIGATFYNNIITIE